MLNKVLFVDGGYSPEARAVFAALTNQPTQARKRIIDKLIKGLKSAGVWSLCDFIYVRACHEESAGNINWKNPTETVLAKTGSVTFTVDRGFAGDGSTGFHTGPTNFLAMTKYTQNSAHLSIWSRTAGQVANATCGTETVSTILLRPRNASDLAGARVNNAVTTGGKSNTNGVGFFIGNRNNSSDFNIFKDGVDLGSTSDTSISVPAGPLSIGKVNSAFSTVEVAFVAGGADVSAFAMPYYLAVAAYMTAVGAA